MFLRFWGSLDSFSYKHISYLKKNVYSNISTSFCYLLSAFRIWKFIKIKLRLYYVIYLNTIRL